MGLILRKFKHPGKADKTSLMYSNARSLLEKLRVTNKGEYNPYRSFSIEEVKTATNNFDIQNVIGVYSLHHEVYKGFLHESPVFVMKFRDNSSEAQQYCLNNTFLAVQMCPGKTMKLMGCCLETQTDLILVFQSVKYCSLADRIYLHVGRPDFEPLLWTHKLKIAMEIAMLVTFFHLDVDFGRPIVIRNIHPSNIFFNEEHRVKLLDFSWFKCIPEGRTYVTETAVVGPLGYLAPEYCVSGYYNEKCEVFSFGGLLLELLTGRRIYDRFSSGTDGKYCFLPDHVLKHMENNRLKDIVDPIIVGDGLSAEKEKQLQSFADLAIKCYSQSPKNRPTMVDATKQIRQLYFSCNSC